jgi:hypothetical protein
MEALILPPLRTKEQRNGINGKEKKAKNMQISMQIQKS